MKRVAALVVLLALPGCTKTRVRKGNPMKLNICGQKTIVNPSDKEIREALSRLDTRSGDAFVILGPTDMTYIQASGDRNVGFDLEYQESTVEQHFRAKNENITLDDVMESFTAYRAGRTDWKDKFDFRRVTW